MISIASTLSSSVPLLSFLFGVQGSFYSSVVMNDADGIIEEEIFINVYSDDDNNDDTSSKKNKKKKKRNRKKKKRGTTMKSQTGIQYESVIRELDNWIAKGAIVSKDELRYPNKLIIAAMTGHVKAVTILLSKGARVLYEYDGETAMHFAVKYGHLDVLILLLQDKKSQINRGPIPPLHYCVGTMDRKTLVLDLKPNMNIFQYLIHRPDIDLDSRDGDGDTPMHRIMYIPSVDHQKRLQMADMMIQNGADINAQNKRGQSILHRACHSNRGSIVKLLIKHNVNINVNDNSRHTAFLSACINAYTHHTYGASKLEEILIDLIDAGSSVDAIGYIDIAKIYKNNPCVGSKETHHHDYLPVTPLLMTIYRNKDVVTQALLDNGANIDQIIMLDMIPNTALTLLVQYRFDEALKKLLTFNPSLEWKNHRGYTALCCASYLGYQSAIEILLSHGANVNHTTLFGECPLSIAVHQGFKPTVTTLLNAGARVVAAETLYHHELLSINIKLSGDNYICKPLVDSIMASNSYEHIMIDSSAYSFCEDFLLNSLYKLLKSISNVINDKKEKTPQYSIINKALNDCMSGRLLSKMLNTFVETRTRYMRDCPKYDTMCMKQDSNCLAQDSNCFKQDPDCFTINADCFLTLIMDAFDVGIDDVGIDDVGINATIPCPKDLFTLKCISTILVDLISTVLESGTKYLVYNDGNDVCNCCAGKKDSNDCNDAVTPGWYYMSSWHLINAVKHDKVLADFYGSMWMYYTVVDEFKTKTISSDMVGMCKQDTWFKLN